MTQAEPAVIEASNLVKVYRTGVRAVDGVSFEIRRGETFGLVGESGSGKSTVAAMLLGLEKVTEGQIRLEGDRIDHLSARALRPVRRSMQLVMQDPISSLNRRKTVEQTLELPLQLYTPMDKRRRSARIVELLDLVGLPERMRARYPHELSGGQCQRVNIARALAVAPRFLVLDESVSAVDVLMQAQILNLLNQLQRDLGLTYLFVSHDLAVVRYMCSRIAVMQSGRILETGSRQQIFTNAASGYTRALVASAPASLAARAVEREGGQPG